MNGIHRAGMDILHSVKQWDTTCLNYLSGSIPDSAPSWDEILSMEQNLFSKEKHLIQ